MRRMMGRKGGLSTFTWPPPLTPGPLPEGNHGADHIQDGEREKGFEPIRKRFEAVNAIPLSPSISSVA
jgi:hypothetical protein